MIIFLHSLFVHATPLAQEPLIQPLNDAQINWTQMQLEAHSSYASRTQSWGYRESLACQNVSKKIHEYIGEVPVSAHDTISTLQENPQIKGDFVDGLRDWKTAESRYIHEEHEVEVHGYLSLQAYLRKSLIHFANSSVTDDPEIHTGLIIDARGTDFQPVVMPQVFGASGELLFDIQDFSKKSAQDTLPVRYVRTPVDPLCAQIVGKTPAMVRAEKSVDGGLILATPSALPNTSDLKAISAKGKIVIVLSPFP